MFNNKGVSLTALVITIIVLIIIAGIVMQSGIGNIGQANKSAFMTDLENAILLLQKYETRAEGLSDPMLYFSSDNLQWDGVTERAVNTGKLEDGENEDTINYIFENHIPNTLKGKLKIINGELYINKDYYTEFEWATEHYKYMLSGDN